MPRQSTITLPRQTVANKPKRSPISMVEKAAFRRIARENPNWGQQRLRAWFAQTYGHDISSSTTSEILGKKYQHLDEQEPQSSERKRERAGKWPALERALWSWMVEERTIVSGEYLKQMAVYFWYRLPEYQGQPVPQFSKAWLQKFLSRRGVPGRSQQRAQQREAGSVSLANEAMALNSNQSGRRSDVVFEPPPTPPSYFPASNPTAILPEIQPDTPIANPPETPPTNSSANAPENPPSNAPANAPSKIPLSEAIHCIEKLQAYAEQQPWDANYAIHQLVLFRREILAREMGLGQGDIRSFLT